MILIFNTIVYPHYRPKTLRFKTNKDIKYLGNKYLKYYLFIKGYMGMAEGYFIVVTIN